VASTGTPRDEALYRLLKGVDRGMAVLMVILGSFMQVPSFFSAYSCTDRASCPVSSASGWWWVASAGWRSVLRASCSQKPS